MYHSMHTQAYAQRIGLSFRVGLSLVVCAGLTVVLGAFKYEHDATWVTHTIAVEQQLNHVSLLLPNRNARHEVLRSMRTIGNLTHDNPHQQTRIAQFMALVPQYER